MMRRRAFLAGVGAAVATVSMPLTEANAAAAAATLLVVVYANGTYPARPAGASPGTVRYIGPTQPPTWLVGDEWIQPLS